MKKFFAAGLLAACIASPAVADGVHNATGGYDGASHAKMIVTSWIAEDGGVAAYCRRTGGELSRALTR